MRIWKKTLSFVLSMTMLCTGLLSSGERQETASAASAELSVAKIATGSRNSMAILEDGSVWLWGQNTSGELGDGTTTSRNLPTYFPTLSNIAAIIGRNHTLALATDKTVWAWGLNNYGQVGTGTASDKELFPKHIPNLTDVIAVEAGRHFSLALKSDGTVWAWGQNDKGQTGTGNTSATILNPERVAGLTDIVSIAAGGDHSLAVKSDGTVWAWGSNTYSAISTTSITHSATPLQVTAVTNAKAVSAGHTHSMALLHDGTVMAWGDKSNGKLGDIPNIFTNLPQKIKSLSNITAISSRANHSLALKSDGTVYAWGSNHYSQLGYATSESSNATPEKIQSLSDVSSISVGDYHSLITTKDGSAWSFGGNILGELGDGTNSGRWLPKQIFGFIKPAPSANTITTGEHHSLAVKPDSSLWAWGYNAYGQVGDGSQTDQHTPVSKSALASVQQISAGYGYSLARRNDGTLWTFGQNQYGQLGDGTTTDSTRPVQVALQPVKRADSGYYHSLAIADDNTLWTWGRNEHGQLGDGTTTSRSTPIQVPDLQPVKQATGGFAHSLALKEDGTVWAWGRNDLGQLGINSNVNQSAPVQVPGLTNIIEIAAGSLHSLALKSDGTVWAWGYNKNGQLGEGTNVDSSIPVQVRGLTGIVSIGAGYGHSVALKNDGTVAAWGYNYNGQLGDGTRDHSSLPMQVAGLGQVSQIAVGGYHNLALKSDGTYWAWGNNSYGRFGDGTTTYSTEPVQTWNGFSLSLWATTNSTNRIDVNYAVNVPVHHFVVKRDGVEVYRGTSTKYTDTGLAPFTPYQYTVEAYSDTEQLLGRKKVVTATLAESSSFMESLEQEPYFQEEFYPLETF